MNARFFELPAERQAAMRNAGLEVFAKQNYAKASMEEAARLAGVSKALLIGLAVCWVGMGTYVLSEKLKKRRKKD